MSSTSALSDDFCFVILSHVLYHENLVLKKLIKSNFKRKKINEAEVLSVSHSLQRRANARNDSLVVHLR